VTARPEVGQVGPLDRGNPVTVRGPGPELKAIAGRLLRISYLAALATWWGGFTIYSAVVIPILHDHLGSPLDVGLITRQVTRALNLIGALTLPAGWWLLGRPRRGAPARGRADRWRRWPLAISTACLAVLLALHAVLDRKLDTGRLAGFYPWHRAYLWTSTVQWAANLALLVQGAGALTPSPRSGP
jgi:hypothetical protein